MCAAGDDTYICRLKHVSNVHPMHSVLQLHRALLARLSLRVTVEEEEVQV